MNNQKERRTIQGYEGIYEVTSTGRIFTFRENRALARCMTSMDSISLD